MLCLCLNVHLSGLRHLLNKMIFSSYHQLHKTPRYHIRHLTFCYEHEPSSWMWCRRVALHCINQSSNNYLAFLHHTTIAFNRSNARIPSSEDADPSFLKASSLPSVLQTFFMVTMNIDSASSCVIFLTSRRLPILQNSVVQYSGDESTYSSR